MSANTLTLNTASGWRRRFLAPIARQRTALVGLAILAVYVVGALLAPWIASHDPTAQDLMASCRGPVRRTGWAPIPTARTSTRVCSMARVWP